MVEKQTKMKPPANHCLYILYIRPKTGVGKRQNVIKYHKMAPSYWGYNLQQILEAASELPKPWDICVV